MKSDHSRCMESRNVLVIDQGSTILESRHRAIKNLKSWLGSGGALHIHSGGRGPAISMSSRTVCSTNQIPGQSGLQSGSHFLFVFNFSFLKRKRIQGYSCLHKELKDAWAI